jgi:hypothetical protein
MRSPLPPLLAVLLLAFTASSASAQSDAFLDPDARILHAAARARWREVDRSLIRYQAVVSQRLGVGLRLPLRDRTLVSHESAARLIWERGMEGERGGVTGVQMLALSGGMFDEDDDGRRSCSGAVCVSAGADGLFFNAFQPRGDPLMLGLSRWDDDEEDGFEHPIAEGAELHYRFRTGDTLTVTLPDGRTLRIVELSILPRRDDPHLLSGALWIEPGTGALVRAVYRLARPLDLEQDTDDSDIEDIPGLLRPFIVDVTLVAVDYALWDFRMWMPRSLRVEGTVRAGILSSPVAGEIAYEIEEVVTAADTGSVAASLGPDAAAERLAALAPPGLGPLRVSTREGRRGRRVSYLVPEDVSALQRSPQLPEPIWSEDAAFVRPEEIAELARSLAQVAGPMDVATVANLDWGLQRPDLVRYNRVEGISVGARGSLRFGLGDAPVSAVLTARLGSADLEPRGALALTHETLGRSLTFSAYRDLQLVEPSTRGLGVGNSLMALLFGRDDGDYYQATGVAIGVTPPVAERAWYRARAYAERQDSAARETNASVMRQLGWDGGFRVGAPGFHADQAGVELTLSPWWGADPMRPGAGVEIGLQAERGDFDFERARLALRASLPLLAGSRLALSASGGTSWGSPSPQRLWTLGGPTSLRGFAPGVRIGPTFLSGRGELVVPLSRVPAARAVGLALFMDGGWAGGRDRIRWDEAIASAGVGLSILDGILRLDAAWGWHGQEGRRLDLYLDGLL